MNKTLILIHGRAIKPPKKVMERLWTRALEQGILRDYPHLHAAFVAAKKEFVYYGDLSRGWIGSTTCGLIRRARKHMRSAFQELLASPKEAFLAQCGKAGWQVHRRFAALFQTSSWSVLTKLRILGPLVEVAFPDVRAYWRRQQSYYATIQHRLSERLQRAAASNDHVCLVAHSLGTIVSYDCLQHLSCEAQVLGASRPLVDLWVTLGSPLGDETVQERLCGWCKRTGWRYPSNIRRWVNISAQDDLICRDPTVADDFARMVKDGLVESIRDVEIFNPANRERRPYPHCDLGYLMHPSTISAIAEWLAK